MTNIDYKDIEQLLERYWQCETSAEEGATLRDFSAKEEVPAHLLRYENLPVYQRAQQKIGLNESSDTRILAEVESTVVKTKRLTPTGHFIPLFRAVAIIVVILSLGNVVQHSFSGDDGSTLATDTIGKQVTTPSAAISDDMKTEQVLTDSSTRVSHRVQVVSE